jgi:hypothetical protein
MLNDVWALDAASGEWSQILPQGTPPDARVLSGMVYDPSRDRVVVFGGSWYNDTWVLRFSGPGAPAWEPLAVAGTSPSRYGMVSIYDPLRDRVVMFGGYSQSTSAHYNDVWELTFSGTPTWHPLSIPPPLPVPRELCSGVYDAANDRMVVFGGWRYGLEGGYAFSDVWALPLSGAPHWTQLFPDLATKVGARSSTVYDPARGRMIVFGGHAGQQGTMSADATVVSLRSAAVFDRVIPAGMVPAPRYGQVATWDAAGDQMLVFGGWSPNAYTNDTYVLDFGGFTLDAGPNLRQRGTVTRSITKNCYDAGEMVTLTAAANPGNDFNGWIGDASGTDNPLTVTMDQSRTIAAEFVREATDVGDAPGTLAFALGAVRPNPASRLARIEYTVGRGSAVRLSILDVAGREIARLVDGVRPAGPHSASWDVRGARTAAGVYFVRYQTASGTWTRRFALVP